MIQPRLSPTLYFGTLAFSLILFLAIGSVCLLVGSSGFGLPKVPDDDTFRAIMIARRDIVLQAGLVGAALAAAGVAYQAILRNPLADPYLLGIASGATLGSALWRFPTTLATLAPLLAIAGLQSATFMGALLAVALVLALGSRRGRLDPPTILLTGVIVSSLCAAAVLVLISIHPESAASGGTAAILIGSLQSNLSTAQFRTAAILILAGLLALQLLASPLSIATLSDTEAEAIGVRIHRLRWTALLTASLTVAAAVSISGPIGFVGLICPHLARLLVGPDPRRLLPVATSLGASLLALADGVTRLLSSPAYLSTQLPVGTLTALLGGPFFLLLLLQQRKQN